MIIIGGTFSQVFRMTLAADMQLVQVVAACNGDGTLKG